MVQSVQKRQRRAVALPPEERRSMIVAATLPLLMAHGERVTTRQIADAAGIAEGTIFRAFADKDEVLRAAIDHALDPAPLEDALGALDEDLAFDDAVAAAIAVLRQRVLDVWRVLSSVGPGLQEGARRPVEDSPALLRLFERHRHRLAVEPRVAARLLRTLTLATTHPLLSGGELRPDDVRTVFLHGVEGPR